MKNRYKLSKILPGISTYAVLIALITIAIFQYRWVISSAETDITELYKSLTYSIDSGLLQQSQDIPKLYNNPLLNENLNDEMLIIEVNNLKNNLIKTYGKESIINISHINISQKSIYSELYYNEWEFDMDSPKELIGQLKAIYRPNLNEVLIIEENKNIGEIWILFPLYNRYKDFIGYKLDIKDYYSNLVEELSKEILTNYQVKVYNELPKNINIIGEQEYAYSPLKTIKSIILKNRQSWFSSFPYHFISLSGPPMNNLPDQRRPPSDLRNEHQSIIYIDILDDDKSLILSKENNLTLQWLLILLLIIGIGIAYILILSQISKLKQLRLKEKEFIATITHELRTPLTVIQAASDNIKSGILKKERVIEYGQLITDQSIRLASMIEGILLFSRLEGKAEKPPYMETVKFINIKESLEVFSKSLMDKSSNKIEINFNKLPNKAISHRDTIELILTNLISNSNKHAFKDGEIGKIVVDGKISGTNSLKFKVSDNGVGINPSEKKEIFDPFFRGKRSLKYQIKGTGLGLFLSYRKANLIGGTLKVDNNIEKGTVFTLKIPYTPVTEETQK